MSEYRLPVALSLGIALVAIVSGPLVGGVDFTRTNTIPEGSGTVDVTVESVPTDDFVLERNRFVPGRYHLSAPPAVVHVNDIQGNPLVRYSIDVPGLWYSTSSRYELDRHGGGRLVLRPSPIGLTPSRVQNGSYDASVSIWVHSNGRQINVYEDSITLEVRG